MIINFLQFLLSFLCIMSRDTLVNASKVLFIVKDKISLNGVTKG